MNALNVNIGGSYTITGASVNPAPGGSGIPNHTHPLSPTTTPGYVAYNSAGTPSSYGTLYGYSYYTGYSAVSTGPSGGGVAHSHTASSSIVPLPIGPNSSTPLSFGFSLKYIDVILCTRTG